MRERSRKHSLQSRQVDDEDTERLVKERRKRKAASHSQSQVLDHQTQRLRSSQVGSRIPHRFAVLLGGLRNGGRIRIFPQGLGQQHGCSRGVRIPDLIPPSDA